MSYLEGVGEPRCTGGGDGLDGGGVLQTALKYRGVASKTPRHNH